MYLEQFGLGLCDYKLYIPYIPLTLRKYLNDVRMWSVKPSIELGTNDKILKIEINIP